MGKGTDRAEGYRSRRKTNEPTVSGMGLMHRVGIVVAQLVDDLADSLIFPVGAGFTDDALQTTW